MLVMGDSAAYKVNLGSLTEGKHGQDFVIDTAFFRSLEDTEVIDADVLAHLDVDCRNGVYECTFTLKGMIHIPCDRCLDAMKHPVDTSYHLTVKYGREYDDSGDDVLIIPDTEMYLNVANMLHDTIVLTIPMRHVHPEGKCNRDMEAVLSRHSAIAADSGESVESGGLAASAHDTGTD